MAFLFLISEHPLEKGAILNVQGTLKNIFSYIFSDSTLQSQTFVANPS